MSDINQIDGKKQQCLYNRETGGVCHTRKQTNKIKGFKDQWGKKEYLFDPLFMSYGIIELEQSP